jgi:hypothetical protein
MILREPRPRTTLVINRAIYGVPGDPTRTRDVRERLQRMVDAGEIRFSVARMAEWDDPAYRVVKTLIVDYTVNGRALTARGQDPETIELELPAAPEPVAEVHGGADGRLRLEAREPGHYVLKSLRDRIYQREVAPLPPPLEVRGRWKVRFAPGGGAPESITLERLLSWSEHADPGVRYYSGTATYSATFDVPAGLLRPDRRLDLDLGRVEVMAAVRLNGRDLGTLWKPPYRVDVTTAVRPETKTLEVSVVNLWINRLIGDEQLPEDSERNPSGTLKAWPSWLLEGRPSSSGRTTFTSWRLWRKGDPLQPSGLLGPVQLRATAVLTIP